jgi:hypothetical protein
VIWNRVNEIASDDVVLGKCAVPGRRCCEDSVWAKVVFAVPAVAAMATRDAGFDCYSISDFDVGDFVADFNDGAYRILDSSIKARVPPHTRALVAQHNWTFEYEVADAAFLPVMDLSECEWMQRAPVSVIRKWFYIASANTCLCNMDADIFWSSKTRYWSVFEGNISDGS